MEIDGYEFVTGSSAYAIAVLLTDCQDKEVGLKPIFGNDAMWHYMTTGQVEGQEIERTATGTEEGTNHQS